MKVSGPLNLAGLEYVANLTALNALTDLFEGRIVNVNGTVYIYSGSAWSALAAGAASVPNITAPTAGQILRSDGTIAGWDEQYPDDTGASGKFLQADGAGNVSWQDPPATIPAQTGNAAKYLTTDGTSASWSAVLRSGVAAGFPNHVLINNGSGVWISEAALAASRGGLGTDASSFTGFVKAASGVFSAAAISTSDLPSGIPATKIGANTNVSDTEFGYLDGVTSAIQTQLDSKLPLAGGTLTGPLILNADPSAALGAVTKQYVDNVISSLRVKDSVKAATSANIALTGLQTIDGVSLIAGDRVLVRFQTNAYDNGIYVVASGTWSRATDANTWAKLTAAFCFVEQGTVYGDVGWVCTITAGGTLGVTPVTWVQFSGAGTYTAGSGLNLSGTTFSARLDTGGTLADSGSGVGQGLKVSDTVPLVTPGITQYADMTAISTPGAPAAGKVRFYAKSDGKLYKRDSSTGEQPVGGGLQTSLQSTGFTAQAGYQYLCNTTSSGFTATLPAGVTGSVVRFTDDSRTWASGNLTIAPATGETIGGLAANDTLVCDITGAWVQLAWDGSKWVVETNGYVGSISSGTLSTATGMGAKNYLTDTASNWVPNTGSILVGTETTTSFLPANYTKTSALRITNSGGSYARARFTLDKADYGKKFQFSFDQAYGGTSGDYTLAVWSNTQSDYLGTATQLTLQTSSISALTGSFITTLDMPNASAPYIEVRITGVTGSTPLYLNNLYMGPGVQVQGAALGGATSFTPVFSGVTMTTVHANYTRIGQYAYIEYEGTASADATGTVFFDVSSLFSGASIDTTIWSGGTTRQVTGAAVAYCPIAHYNLAPTYVGTGNTISFRISGTANVLDASNPSTDGGFDNTDRLSFTLMVPISGWSSTVNLGAGAQVEWAFNDDTSTSNNSLTANMKNGPDGITFGSFTSNATTFGVTAKRVRFQYPIQNDDVIVIEINAGNGWQELGTLASVQVLQRQYNSGASSSVAYGMYFDRVAGSTTDIDVNFGTAGRTTANTGLGTAGETWASISSYKWRLRKNKSSSACGFGLASTDGSAGLYKPGQAPGLVTGATIAPGYVGERIEVFSSTANNAVNSTPFTSGTLPLTAGVWDLYAMCTLSAAGTLTGTGTLNLAINTAANFSGTTSGLDRVDSYISSSVAGGNLGPVRVYLSAANSNYRAVGQITVTSGTGTASIRAIAVRVA